MGANSAGEHTCGILYLNYYSERVVKFSSHIFSANTFGTYQMEGIYKMVCRENDARRHLLAISHYNTPPPPPPLFIHISITKISLDLNYANASWFCAEQTECVRVAFIYVVSIHLICWIGLFA